MTTLTGLDPTAARSRHHLAAPHPLARLARERCRSVHGPSWGRIGGVACGACWERVIRDDERFAVLFDLPRTLDADPDYVDVVAVERACAGERVRLTAAERLAAVALLVDRGYSRHRIARRLGMEPGAVGVLLADLLAELDADRAVSAVSPAAADSDGRAA